MQSQDDRIRFDISLALSLTSLRPRHRDASKSDRERAFAAQKICEYLKQCGWRFEREPPRESSFARIGRPDGDR